MSPKTTLLCTVIAMSFFIKTTAQNASDDHDLATHLLDHILPGMTQHQIDSIYNRAYQNNSQMELDRKILIEESIKKGKENSTNKELENCDLANWSFDNGTTSQWTTSGCVSLLNTGSSPYSGYSNVYGGSGYSLQLSNDNNYSCLNSQAARTYAVPLDGKTFITFHFKVDIFNFPHAAVPAAKFKFNIYDENQNKLPCPSYEAYYAHIMGPVGIPSLQTTPLPAAAYNPAVAGAMASVFKVSYSDWHSVTVDLTPYAGTNITLVFSNVWCLYNVDWIYTIIDVECPVNVFEPTQICFTGDDLDLCVPEGIDASCQWAYNGAVLSNTTPCISATESGVYTLSFLPNYLECSEVGYEQTFEIMKQPIAAFHSDELCMGEDITLYNDSQFGQDYEWNYGNQSSVDFIPDFDYEQGINEVELIVTSEFCDDTIQELIIVHQLPIPKMEFKNHCLGESYTFVNNSYSNEGGTLSAMWTFNDTSVDYDWHGEYTPEDLAPFELELQVTNQFGCSSSIGMIGKVFPLPNADFMISDSLLEENTAFISLNDASSVDVVDWLWDFGDGATSSIQDPVHEYLGTGQRLIQLIVQNQFNCADTTIKMIEITPSISVYVPNTFTPNDDEFNQLFLPVFSGTGLDQSTYNFSLFNRWGDVAFYTENIVEGWDGGFNSFACPQGTYTWKISFVANGAEVVEMGHVNLIR